MSAAWGFLFAPAEFLFNGINFFLKLCMMVPPPMQILFALLIAFFVIRLVVNLI